MEIRKAVEQFYEEMSQMGMNAESMNLNINYLLFQLIHLASEQDNDVNQEEILRLISESSFENGILRGSKAQLSFSASKKRFQGRSRHGRKRNQRELCRQPHAEGSQ